MGCGGTGEGGARAAPRPGMDKIKKKRDANPTKLPAVQSDICALAELLFKLAICGGHYGSVLARDALEPFNRGSASSFWRLGGTGGRVQFLPGWGR